MSTRHSEHGRADGDFYSEPSWVVDALLRNLLVWGDVHDPCCGLGTIVDAAIGRGINASGADIADRSGGRFPVRDFLEDAATYPNIIANPPYRVAPAIVEHALQHVERGGQVAMLAPVGFLASQRRHALFACPEMELVLVLSRRPSLPPGELLIEQGESIRGHGSTDFAWVVWRRGGRTADAARIRWAAP